MHRFVSRRFHLIIDACDCDNNLISNKELIAKTIKTITKLIGMQIIEGPIITMGREENPGLTGFAIIDFSHISIHTFTKINELCLDIFSCKEFDYEKIKQYIKREFKLSDNRIYKTVVRYSPFDIDYRKQDFSPHKYLREYYTGLSKENKRLLEWYNQVYSEIGPKKSLLEIGGGPTIYQLISASKHVDSITFSDYSKDNLKEIKRWVENKKPFNWDNFIEFSLQLENKEPKDLAIRKKLIASKLKELMPLDIGEFDSRLSDRFDIIQSNFCLESSTDDLPKFKRMLLNVNKYLKRNGIFLMAAIGGALAYRLGDKLLPAIYLDSDLVIRYLKEAGFRVERIEKTPADHPHICKYHDLLFIKAVKA